MKTSEQHSLLNNMSKTDEAIKLLQDFEPPEGYYVAFSGGKDSIVVYDLVKASMVKADFHYNLTTVDPPELVNFIKEFDDVAIHHPDLTMWQLIEKKGMMPTRWARFCCDVLKERGGNDRRVVTGVRRAESPKRKGRGEVHECFRKSQHKIFINPIYRWSDDDVWDYIIRYKLPYCSLYDEGFKRLGCVMCPMTQPKQIKKEMERWPKLASSYKRACYRVFDPEKSNFNTAEEWWNWWSSGCPSPPKSHPNQVMMFD